MPILIPRPVVSLSKYPGGKEAPALPTAAGILRLSLKEMSLPDTFGVTHPGLAGCFGVITLIPRRFLPKFASKTETRGDSNLSWERGNQTQLQQLWDPAWKPVRNR